MKIIFTGGGSAGHVTPNIALLPYFRGQNYEIHYIGTEKGIEKDIISSENDVIYHNIRAGKLRRYLSVKTFTDFFRVIGGYFDSKKIIKEVKPDIIFSKGGFVSVPVVLAGKRRHIPMVSHESDITPGLANKLTTPFVNKICVTFPDALSHLDKEKAVFTGSPIRQQLYCGNAESGRNALNFDNKPVILVIGGSLGAVAINNAIRDSLDELVKNYNIIHICGKNNLVSIDDAEINKSYKQFEFISKGLEDYFALADFIISRAGSNSIHEFLALNKPMILIPLSREASRGDQEDNAKSFASRNFAYVLEEKNLNSSTLFDAIDYINQNRNSMIDSMKSAENTDGTNKIINVIVSALKNNQ